MVYQTDEMMAEWMVAEWAEKLAVM